MSEHILYHPVPGWKPWEIIMNLMFLIMMRYLRFRNIHRIFHSRSCVGRTSWSCIAMDC